MAPEHHSLNAIRKRVLKRTRLSRRAFPAVQRIERAARAGDHGVTQAVINAIAAETLKCISQTPSDARTKYVSRISRHIQGVVDAHNQKNGASLRNPFV